MLEFLFNNHKKNRRFPVNIAKIFKEFFTQLFYRTPPVVAFVFHRTPTCDYIFQFLWCLLLYAIKVSIFIKHLCQSLFFNKVAGLKKKLWYRCFPVNFVKILWKFIYIEHIWWLLLFNWNDLLTRHLIIPCFSLKRMSMHLTKGQTWLCGSTINSRWNWFFWYYENNLSDLLKKW